MDIRKMLAVVVLCSPLFAAWAGCEVKTGDAARDPSRPDPFAPPPNPNPAPALPQAIFRAERSLYFTRNVKDMFDANNTSLKRSMFQVRSSSTNGDNNWWVRAEGWKMLVHVDIESLGKKKKTRVGVTYLCNEIPKNRKDGPEFQKSMEAMAESHLADIGKQIGETGTNR